tara:strand:+ start:3008 stop:3910 length:903 start_codon:yes stop_codon:yes gene_type:complete
MTGNFDKIINKDKSVFFYEKPFPIMIIDNLLQPEIFCNIKKEYLNKMNIQENQSFRQEKLTLDNEKLDKYDNINILGGGHDQKSKEEIESIFNDTEYFKLLLAYFDSEEFINFIWSHFRKFKVVNKSFYYRIPKLRKPTYKRTIFDNIFYKNYYLNFKIARYPNNSGIGLHTDNNHKVMSFLFYLGFSDNKNRNIGGTQFWDSGNLKSSLKKNLKNNELRDHQFINHENFKLFKNVEPYENRFVAFFRTDHSWHSVEPISGLEKNVTRETLQINFMKTIGHRGLGSLLSKIKQNFTKLLT